MKIAIIGGGPGGLGAALELVKLPFVCWNLYEKKPQISETGGGISLQSHTWRLLERNGAARNINATDIFQSAEGLIEQRRNGRSGELLSKKFNPDNIPLHHQTSRLVRAKLQSALLQNADQSRIHSSKRLVAMEQCPDRRVRILFDDGFVDEVDLVIAADGIRSVVRKFCFPDHTLRWNGQFVYRTIVSQAEVKKISEIPWAPVFWKNTSGLYVYTCPLGDADFEVTTRIRPPQEGQEPVSWGQPFDLHTILHEYNDFCPPIRKLLCLVAKEKTQEFALFFGPRLKRIVNHGNIAFVGDASYPLQGNFGAGAGFALEDVCTLAKTLYWAWSRKRPLVDALELFNSIRVPHYERLFKLVENFASIKAALRAEGLPIDEEISERVKRVSLASESWMYYYEIDKVVDEAIREAENSVKGVPQS
ncbi:Monooxygenase, FAD-binding [Penicillium expansum]|nr:Monooxygenase, FAD-binding [Penicillium expansum]KGO51856.1 Monooxygenase, FAD-binding [Penicillium expansum]